MKLYICGYARHGKDTVAEILKDRFGFAHESSSHIAMRSFLRGILEKEYGLFYDSEEDCYADRVNHRALWYRIIEEYNRDDLTRLSRLIFRDHDIYVGIRNVAELVAGLRELPDTIAIWVDASKRLGTVEPRDSNTITADDCDFTITNNGSVEDLSFKLDGIFSRF